MNKVFSLQSSKHRKTQTIIFYLPARKIKVERKYLGSSIVYNEQKI